jgi:hypothetical protein
MSATLRSVSLVVCMRPPLATGRKTGPWAIPAASKLAARELEILGDQSQPVAEQQRRKRTLIRGPKEFRDIRADLPKPKA